MLGMRHTFEVDESCLGKHAKRVRGRATLQWFRFTPNWPGTGNLLSILLLGRNPVKAPRSLRLPIAAHCFLAAQIC